MFSLRVKTFVCILLVFILRVDCSETKGTFGNLFQKVKSLDLSQLNEVPIVAGAMAVGYNVATPVAVGAVKLAGFTAQGIAMSTSASAAMASAGNVVAGSTVALCQSIGASGTLAYGGTALAMSVPIAGAVVAGAAVYGGLKLYQSTSEQESIVVDVNLSQEDENLWKKEFLEL